MRKFILPVASIFCERGCGGECGGAGVRVECGGAVLRRGCGSAVVPMGMLGCGGAEGVRWRGGGAEVVQVAWCGKLVIFNGNKYPVGKGF